VYLPYPMAWPRRFVIDPGACSRCGACVPACPQAAIHLDEAARDETILVGAVILATGWDPPDARSFEGLGYGLLPNVVTNLEMERLASPTGPTGGRIVRPSDGAAPRSVAFVQCAGSRDEKHLKHCSAACCMASLKQARYVLEQQPDAKVTIFYIDLRTPGRLELFLADSRADPRLRLVKGKVGRVSGLGDGGDLLVEAEDTMGGLRLAERFSLVVLATGMVPATSAGSNPATSNLLSDESGFFAKTQEREGFFVAGCAHRPADVATCTREATGVAMRAILACKDAPHG
jgi:quinone-modifying oxidoreductase, subunit QmoA